VRSRVEHDPAAERVGRGDRADDDAVVGAGEQRPLDAKLPEPVPEVREATGRLARAVMDLDAVSVAGAAQVERRRGCAPARRRRARPPRRRG